jgi:hypothetical protein
VSFSSNANGITVESSTIGVQSAQSGEVYRVAVYSL